ncbi:MAG TPA: low molecular weight protein-tyrosine-phosphatase [Acidimicrobiia bacterium]|nr:low molecular weight protein-tyrosine-phosphatase [Acidimicrobiia bacterium]
MVCWGNICRSPAAEGILRHMTAGGGLDIEVDSAGTSREHQGQEPHRMTIAEARKRGFDVSKQRARQLRPTDFETFDLILTADEIVNRIVRERAPAEARARVLRMTEVGPDFAEWPEVPDPYYGNESDYVQVFDLLERAMAGLMETLASGRRP